MAKLTKVTDLSREDIDAIFSMEKNLRDFLLQSFAPRERFFSAPESHLNVALANGELIESIQPGMSAIRKLSSFWAENEDPTFRLFDCTGHELSTLSDKALEAIARISAQNAWFYIKEIGRTKWENKNLYHIWRATKACRQATDAISILLSR